MHKLKNAFKKRRTWFALGALGTAVATGQVNQDTVLALVDLFSIFGG